MKLLKNKNIESNFLKTILKIGKKLRVRLRIIAAERIECVNYPHFKKKQKTQ